MAHNNINLELRKDKSDNVWRYIYAWRQLPSGHGIDINYLFVHALVQWDSDRNCLQNIFCILMQYSKETGKNVDVSQPAHILEEDATIVLKSFNDFVTERKGKR